METLTQHKTQAVKRSTKVNDIILSVHNLNKKFGGQVVLDNVSFDLKRGGVVLLRGENGSGKTTLLNILTGNLEPDSGEIRLFVNREKEVFSWPRKWWQNINPFDHFTPERIAWEGVGRVWQDIRLFPTMTALENVAVASPAQRGENPLIAFLRLGKSKEELYNIKQASKWLSGLGLCERLDSSCDKISLGQMKRVAIARAVHAGAKILFLDEPLSGLDKNGMSDVMSYLEDLVKENSITLVIVEHVFNIPTILKLADTIWTLSNGKLVINKADEIKLDNTDESHNLHDLFNAIAGETGRIYSEELPNGARLTTVTPDEYKESQLALEVKDLVVKRGIRTVIEKFSIKIRKGQIALLEAPNGWGKSTLLDAVAGIQSTESGKIWIDGKEISSMPTHKRMKMGLAYLKSNQQTFASLSVKEHRKLADTKNHLFGNTLNGNSKGNYLSGGEKQKLLIDMLPEADIYLLDEPLMGLDNNAIIKYKNMLKKIVEKGKTVFITEPIKGA